LLAQVDLSGVQTAYLALVRRLRHTGLALSDRRAVKLQRLVAASALICGRGVAQLSDLWVFRYIWDNLEQQEVLASIVEETIKKAKPDGADHPRARNANAPDPETIARDFETIALKLAEKDVSAAERACLKDRVSVLAARCQWIQNVEQRTFLIKRADELWKKFEK